MSHPTTRSDLLKKRADQFSRVLKAVGQGDVRALHRARVASRRLRELIPMLQLDAETSRKLTRRLRKVTKRLGTVRELDVLLLVLDELHDSRRDRNIAVGRVGVAVSKERDQARKRLSSRLPLDEMRRLVRKLERTAADLQTADAVAPTTMARSWRWAIGARVISRATRASTAVQEAGALYLPDRLHTVRIALKKLRYGVELAADLADPQASADLRTLKRAQDLLGRMHDLQMLMGRVRQVQASLTPPNVAVWRDLDALVTSLEDDCRRLHARYMRSRDGLTAVLERLSAPSQAPVGRAHADRRAG